MLSTYKVVRVYGEDKRLCYTEARLYVSKEMPFKLISCKRECKKFCFSTLTVTKLLEKLNQFFVELEKH